MGIRDVSVKLYGSTAIVVGVYHTEGRYRDRPYDHVGRFTDTWILQNDRWQCVASHASLINKR
jgi:ketosteroid isomerase-like protein